MSHWKSIVRKKEGKHVSIGMIQKRKDMNVLNNQQDAAMDEAKAELRLAIEKWKEHVKNEEIERG